MGFLRALVGSEKRRQKRAPARERARNRLGLAPRIEGLEERMVLSTITVTNNADSGPGSLRDAIAGASSGDIVNFSPALAGKTITLTSGEIDIETNLSIIGPGPNQLTISGNNASRIFDVQHAPQQSVTLISGLRLVNGSSMAAQSFGGAIYDPLTTNVLAVSNCTFIGNVADGRGGAIATDGPMLAASNTFFYNRALGLNGLTDPQLSNPAAGGAIWTDGTGTIISHNNFVLNQANGGNGALGGYAYGGAIDWVASNGGNLTVVDNAFNDNSATAGNGTAVSRGAEGAGGAVMVEVGYTSGMKASVDNNTFNDNAANGGSGFVGGDAKGGSLAFDGYVPTNPTIEANSNHFIGGTAYGGTSLGATIDLKAVAGSAYGGAVSIDDSGRGGTYTFNSDTITGATAQGGSASVNGTGGAADAQGGNAYGGGVYLGVDDAGAKFSSTGLTLNGDQAMGGAGGNLGVAGLAGGDAAGGGLAAITAVSETITGYTVNLNNVTATDCVATGGIGANGQRPTTGTGGTAGSGGNSFGGGIALDPGNSSGATYSLQNSSLSSNSAVGGAGGNGGYGNHGFNAGSGARGGNAEGGGLAIVPGLTGFNTEGAGQPIALNINVTNTKLLVNNATGGKGGYGGNGSYLGGNGGNGGSASGGAVGIYGIGASSTDQVTFHNAFLFANTARGGNAGLGGDGTLQNGGNGGAGGSGLGGGLDVFFKGAVHLQSSTIYGNKAINAPGAAGGFGFSLKGKTGGNGASIGGGVRNVGIGTVDRTKDTLIIVNTADQDPDVHGPITVL
jgi:hypothetical protein